MWDGPRSSPLHFHKPLLTTINDVGGRDWGQNQGPSEGELDRFGWRVTSIPLRCERTSTTVRPLGPRLVVSIRDL